MELRSKAAEEEDATTPVPEMGCGEVINPVEGVARVVVAVGLLDTVTVVVVVVAVKEVTEIQLPETEGLKLSTGDGRG